jgi:hypothetical protein
MTKTQAERNADYQFRLRTRSSHFGHLNDLRCERLLKSSYLINDSSPEAKTIVAFFTAHPRCERLPHFVQATPGMVFVTLDETASDDEALACHAALSETTSATVMVMRQVHGQPATAAVDIASERLHALTHRMQHEVDELRAAGLWRTTFARDA